MASVSERLTPGKREMSETLAAQIVDYILAAGLRSGTHLTAQELAARFSVSRFPVSQAMQLLASKGVLTHERHRGYFVSGMKQISSEALGLPVKDSGADLYFRLPRITFMVVYPIRRQKHIFGRSTVLPKRS